MTDYWSGSITFTGLGSGTDFEAIIESTMSVEKYRYNQMELWDAQWTMKQEQIQNLNTQLLEYQNQLESMDTVDEFLVKTGTSTDSSVLGVSADSSAEPGTHNVIVNQLAQNDIWTTSTGWTSSDDVVTATDTTFELNYGGTDLSVDVPAGTTAQGLTNLINSELGDDVRATLINDGSEYHLQVRGMDQGADNAITFTDTGIAGLSPADYDNTQTAQNAQLKVDGYPPGAADWIERDTNVIDDVIDDVTLTLYEPTDASGENITIGIDNDAIMENITKFIELTNEIRNSIRALEDDTNGDGEVDEEDAEDSEDEVGTSSNTVFTSVQGNYGVDIVEQNLQNILAAKGLGFMHYDASTGQGDKYSSLSSIGITTDTDENSPDFGNLVIDQPFSAVGAEDGASLPTLEDALNDDPYAVAEIFAADASGVEYSSDFTFKSAVPGLTQAGEYDVQYEVNGGVVTNATINGNPATISADGKSITGSYGYPESGMTIGVDVLADGSYGDSVYIKQGKINETIAELDRLTDPETGTLVIIDQNYQEIIDSNQQRMQDEQARLDQKEQRLVEQYASLEATLGYYDNVNSSLQSQLAQLS